MRLSATEGAGESGIGYYRDPRSGPVQAAALPPPPPTLGLAELSLEEAEAAWASVQGVGVTWQLMASLIRWATSS